MAPAVKADGSTVKAEQSPERSAESGKVSSATTCTTIRNISVQKGPDTLDVIVEGPSSAEPYLLKNPDRLVLDFSNAVMLPAVRNIAVHTKEVLKVRVGRFQAAPPVSRVVIDLSGPRAFEVLPSADQVVVRFKTDATGTASASAKSAPAPVSHPASSAVSTVPASDAAPARNREPVNVAGANAASLKNVAMPVVGAQRSSAG
jgi:hypothetical protein